MAPVILVQMISFPCLLSPLSPKSLRIKPSTASTPTPGTHPSTRNHSTTHRLPFHFHRGPSQIISPNHSFCRRSPSTGLAGPKCRPPAGTASTTTLTLPLFSTMICSTMKTGARTRSGAIALRMGQACRPTSNMPNESHHHRGAS